MSLAAPEEDRQEIVKLYNEGHPYTSIAKLTGYSDVTCAKYVKASGIPLR